MRDIVVSLALLVLVPLSAFHPWIGAMSWTWISLMSPHRLAYGFMYDMPAAMLVGGATLLGMVFSRDPKRLPAAAPLFWLAAFGLWMVVTLFFSIDPGPYNVNQLDKVLKIYFMTFVVVTVIHTRRQVDILVAVSALSIAFYGIKGGIFTLLTGGSDRIFGPDGFVAGNNEIGLALVMTIPLLYYTLMQATGKWTRRGLWAAMVLCAISALATYSRGALLAICAMTAMFIIRSPVRKNLVLPILAMLIFTFAFMPDKWWDRMGTIGEYQEDESAMGRINAWTVAWRVATTHFFGGGFSLETPEIFARFAPNPNFIAVAHSIYFQVLGQHGFVGLLLFVCFWFSTVRTARWLYKYSTAESDRLLARMVEVSLVGYATGGAFLNLAYFDGPYYLMAALVVVRYKLMNNRRPTIAAEPRPGAPPVRGVPTQPTSP